MSLYVFRLNPGILIIFEIRDYHFYENSFCYFRPKTVTFHETIFRFLWWLNIGWNWYAKKYKLLIKQMYPVLDKRNHWFEHHMMPDHVIEHAKISWVRWWFVIVCIIFRRSKIHFKIMVFKRNKVEISWLSAVWPASHELETKFGSLKVTISQIRNSSNICSNKKFEIFKLWNFFIVILL